MKHLPILLLATLCIPACVNQQVSTAPSAAQANAPINPSTLPILLGLDPVRQDLQLTSLQCALLDSLRSDYKARARTITAIGMASEDAAVRSSWDLQNLRKQYNQRALAVLTPGQQTRVRQIERQMMGGSLLASASEQSLLGLSQQQQQALYSIYKNDQASAAAINAKFNSGTMSSFSKMIALHGNQKNTSSRMLAVLTPQQKKKWMELSGQKMVLPKIHDPNANAASLFEGY